MSLETVKQRVASLWSHSVLPALQQYVTIPNQSPAFDPDWRRNGYMEQAVELLANWARAQALPGWQVEVVRLEERTPLILIEVPGGGEETALLYGHLDKQPPMEGWREGLGPWKPVLEEDKLYGRGAADDGYALFAATAALKVLGEERVPCGRCVVLIEASEESGSIDLPVYIDRLENRIGKPGLVVCLDSGCGNYDQLWVTTSLRGLVGGTLAVSVLREGVHSGTASGIVPSTFRILRQLLARLEDEHSGWILPAELHVEIPGDRCRQVAHAARVLGSSVHEDFPFQPGALPVGTEIEELLLNRTWRPQLEVTGAAGLPPLQRAGNVMRPVTSVRLSLRLPPTADPARAATVLRRLFEHEPPYGAKVTFRAEQSAAGWNAPAMAGWLEDSLRRASAENFGREACYLGEGGSIPFMALLGEKFPAAQFVVTGVLGPHANAHGPNEFLHVPTAVKLTACVAQLLHDHFGAAAA